MMPKTVFSDASMDLRHGNEKTGVRLRNLDDNCNLWMIIEGLNSDLSY